MALSLEEKLSRPVYELNLSVRASNLIKNQGIRTIKDLVNSDARQMLSLPGCGKKTITEIIAYLKLVGLTMKNSDDLLSDADIESRIASIQEVLVALSEPKPKMETYHDKRAKDIRMKQITVMLMRVNGTSCKEIAKVVGRTEGTTRNYFSRFARYLVWSADRRRITVAEVLTENNIPLAAIELFRKEGIQMKNTG